MPAAGAVVGNRLRDQPLLVGTRQSGAHPVTDDDDERAELADVLYLLRNLLGFTAPPGCDGLHHFPDRHGREPFRTPPLIRYADGLLPLVVYPGPLCQPDDDTDPPGHPRRRLRFVGVV